MEAKLFYENKYPFKSDCLEIKKQIDLMEYDINQLFLQMNGDGNYKANILTNLKKQKESQFQLKKCNIELDSVKVGQLNTIFDKYSDIAKVRIENQTNKVRNVYIGIATITVLLATIIIIKNK